MRIHSLFLTICVSLALVAQPGSPDLDFNPQDEGFALGDGPTTWSSWNGLTDGQVTAIAPLANGQTWIGGAFTHFDGAPCGGIVLLDADGRLDPSFQTGASIYGSITEIVPQPDGKVLVAGYFLSYAGVPRNGFARLHPDGTLDPSFTPDTGTEPGVHAIALQPDGRIVVGGNFTTVSGTPRSRIARLLSDGSLDATFTGSGTSSTLPTNHVFALALQADGKVLVGGEFSGYGTVPRTRLMRLEADGMLDDTFQPGSGPNAPVATLAVLPDGKVAIGGAFTAFDGTPTGRVAVLEATGALHTAYAPGASNNVQALEVLADGRILVAGHFSTFDGSPWPGLCILQSEGTLDASFVPRTLVPPGSVNLSAVGELPDGRLLAGGNIDHSYDWGRRGITRFLPDGMADLSFMPGGGANDRVLVLAPTADGSCWIGGKLSRFNDVRCGAAGRLLGNGDLDADHAMGLGIGGTVHAITLAPDGSTFLGGWFSRFDTVTAHSLVKLDPSGACDPSFHTGQGIYDGGPGAPRSIRTMAVQADGHLLIGGSFREYNDTTRLNLARILPNGSLDQAFVPWNQGLAFNDVVNKLLVQPDGRILVGGQLSTFGGVPRQGILRLNPNGTLDTSFDQGPGTDAGVLDMVLLPDGSIVLCGAFTSYNGDPCGRIARLSPNGDFDPSFSAGVGADSAITALALAPDGRIHIGGWFTQVDGNPAPHLAALHPNGIFDTSFDPGAGPDHLVYDLAFDANGGLLIAGEFTSYDGVGRNRIARIHTSIVTGGTPATEDQPSIVFPNPTSGPVTVHAATDITAITVTDPTGRVVREHRDTTGLQERIIDLSGQPPGVYVCSVTRMDGVVEVSNNTVIVLAE